MLSESQEQGCTDMNMRSFEIDSESDKIVISGKIIISSWKRTWTIFILGGQKTTVSRLKIPHKFFGCSTYLIGNHFRKRYDFELRPRFRTDMSKYHGHRLSHLSPFISALILESLIFSKQRSCKQQWLNQLIECHEFILLSKTWYFEWNRMQSNEMECIAENGTVYARMEALIIE